MLVAGARAAERTAPNFPRTSGNEDAAPQDTPTNEDLPGAHVLTCQRARSESGIHKRAFRITRTGARHGAVKSVGYRGPH